MAGKRGHMSGPRQTTSLRIFRSQLAENDSPLWAYGRPGAHPSGINTLPGYGGACADVTSHSGRSRAIATENVKMERQRSNRLRNTKLSEWNQKLEDGLLAAVSIVCLLFSLAVVGVSTWLVILSRSVENSSQFNATSPTAASVSSVDSSYHSRHADQQTSLPLFMQRLWELDSGSRLPKDLYEVSPQNHTTVQSSLDMAPSSLFLRMGTMLESYSDTYRTFINLQNDFEARVREDDPIRRNKAADIDAFLSAVMATPIMSETHHFLSSQGAVEGNYSEFSNTLFNVWFAPYSRSSKYSKQDSSGFEHVFVGEIKTNGKVIGFHNWIKFFLEERRGNLDYFGIISSKEQLTLNVQFQWLGHLKPGSAFFLGTSPEFELAVYTVCLFLKTNAPCDFELNNLPVRVVSYDVGHVPGLQVASAFPVAISSVL